MYALSMELEMHRRSKGSLIIRDLRSPGFNKSEMKNYNPRPPRFGDCRSARVPSPNTCGVVVLMWTPLKTNKNPKSPAARAGLNANMKIGGNCCFKQKFFGLAV